MRLKATLKLQKVSYFAWLPQDPLDFNIYDTFTVITFKSRKNNFKETFNEAT
tara:strand:- start:53 stop:208 length:156 start_codon:yes stop_codon:yes gene_type:complete